MMPPKKSKAARKSNFSTNDNEDANVVTDDPNNLEANANDADDEDDDVKDVYFEPIIIDGKRKRSTPQIEKTLRDWLSKHFIEKEDVFLSPGDMHDTYLKMCSSSATFGLEMHIFLKIMQEMYPKGMDLVENSQYAKVIRKRKPKKNKLPKTDGAKLKSKDIIEAIVDLGNPRKGLHYQCIRRYINAHFPELRIDDRPFIVKNALMRATNYGNIECVDGVGACGLYRLPRTREEEQKEIEEEKRVKKEKADKDATKESTETEEMKAEAEKSVTDVSDLKDDATGHPSSEAVDKDDVKPAENKKKSKTIKRHTKPKKTKVYWGKPRHIEDVFSLAITYNNEPKQASSRRIINYIQQHYHADGAENKIKKCLESGLEKGYWQQVAGKIGTFSLEVIAIDPSADDDLVGQISNAIVACSEPKVSSSILLKQYVTDYHPEFKLGNKSSSFKNALQRAILKKLITRVSGIGASGSFRLTDSFTPSPAMLQGKDVVDVSEDESEDEPSDVTDVKQYVDAYVPRPTKRGGGRKIAAAIDRFDPSVPNKKSTKLVNGFKKNSKHSSKIETSREKTQGPKKRGRPLSSTTKSTLTKKASNGIKSPEPRMRGRPKKSTLAKKASIGLESPEPKMRGRPKKLTLAKKTSNAVKSPESRKRGRPSLSSRLSNSSKKVRKDNSDESDSDSDKDSVSSEKYTPTKSSSRGGGGGGRGGDRREKSLGQSVSTPRKIQESEKEISDGDDSEDGEKYTPRKSSSRGGAGDRREKSLGKSVSTPRKIQESAEEISDGDDFEDGEKYTPRKSSSRGGGGDLRQKSLGKSASTSRKIQESAAEISDGDDSEDSEKYTPRKSSFRGGKHQQKPQGKSPSSAKKLESAKTRNSRGSATAVSDKSSKAKKNKNRR